MVWYLDAITTRNFAFWSGRTRENSSITCDVRDGGWTKFSFWRSVCSTETRCITHCLFGMPKWGGGRWKDDSPHHLKKCEGEGQNVPIASHLCCYAYVPNCTNTASWQSTAKYRCNTPTSKLLGTWNQLFHSNITMGSWKSHRFPTNSLCCNVLTRWKPPATQP